MFKYLFPLSALLLFPSCYNVPRAMPRGQATCGTPLGMARSNDYEFSRVGNYTRVTLKDVIPGSVINADASLCVFIDEVK